MKQRMKWSLLKRNDCFESIAKRLLSSFSGYSKLGNAQCAMIIYIMWVPCFDIISAHVILSRSCKSHFSSMMYMTAPTLTPHIPALDPFQDHQQVSVTCCKVRRASYARGLLEWQGHAWVEPKLLTNYCHKAMGFFDLSCISCDEIS